VKWFIGIFIISVLLDPKIVFVVMFGIHEFVQVLCATELWSCLKSEAARSC